ncbi:hypothetical protein GCM10027052_09220 [Parafrigoribacterium mesophilum]
MTTPRRFVPITAAVLGVLTILTGCTSPNTITQTTASPTQSPAPTASLTAPKSRDEAWLEATRTIVDFVDVQYAIQADTGANPERIEPYATGSALKHVKDVAAGLAEKHITTTGHPKWSPNASASTFGDLNPQGGATIPNGIVYVRGCFDVSDQVPTYAGGSPAPVSSQRIYPVQFNVLYLSTDRTWKVDSLQNIVGEQGAPAC